jgi:hypothetical protein
LRFYGEVNGQIGIDLCYLFVDLLAVLGNDLSYLLILICVVAHIDWFYEVTVVAFSRAEALHRGRVSHYAMKLVLRLHTRNGIRTQLVSPRYRLKFLTDELGRRLQAASFKLQAREFHAKTQRKKETLWRWWSPRLLRYSYRQFLLLAACSLKLAACSLLPFAPLRETS